MIGVAYAHILEIDMNLKSKSNGQNMKLDEKVDSSYLTSIHFKILKVSGNNFLSFLVNTIDQKLKISLQKLLEY